MLESSVRVLWRRRWRAAFLSMGMNSCWARAHPPRWRTEHPRIPRAEIGSFADAAKFGELVVLADMGKAEAARAIEPLCMLWCIPGFLRNDWIHAFKLLTQA